MTEAALARRDREEGCAEMDHEKHAPSQSPQRSVQQQELFTSMGDGPCQNCCGRFQHNKVRGELLQSFTDFHIDQEHKVMLDKEI